MSYDDLLKEKRREERAKSLQLLFRLVIQMVLIWVYIWLAIRLVSEGHYAFGAIFIFGVMIAWDGLKKGRW